MIIVDKINCGIFRHGTFIGKKGKLGSQIGPHLSEKECKKLVKLKKIVGCGKPFELIYENKDLYVKKCEYK
jgi:hypothetical protein